VALRVTSLAPVQRPLPLPREEAREATLSALLGRAEPTRAFAQFRATRGENGHFVLYREPGAAELAMEFMRAVTR
jgi:hypothetical protein